MARIPSKDEILAWISENPTQTAKRDIAKAFGIKGAGRIDLKRILKELEEELREQAVRDPLTGCWNRRMLRKLVADLQVVFEE